LHTSKKERNASFFCFFRQLHKIPNPQGVPFCRTIDALASPFLGPRATALHGSSHGTSYERRDRGGTGSGRGNSGGVRRLSRRLYSALGASQRSRLHDLGAIVGKYSLLGQAPVGLITRASAQGTGHYFVIRRPKRWHKYLQHPTMRRRITFKRQPARAAE